MFEMKDGYELKVNPKGKTEYIQIKSTCEIIAKRCKKCFEMKELHWYTKHVGAFCDVKPICRKCLEKPKETIIKITSEGVYKKLTTRSKTEFITDFSGVVLKKKCNKCGEYKELNCFHKEKAYFCGVGSLCKVCKTEKNKVYTEKNRNNIEFIIKRRNYRLKRLKQDKEYRKDWNKRNRELKNYYTRKRRTLKASLPSTLTFEQEMLMKEVQKHMCIISGESVDLAIEHFIPISWGAGGTTFENCYYMDGSLNSSKGNRNPFEWIKTQPEAYQNRFHTVLVPMLAERNGMTVQAFTEYVYECEKAYLNSKKEALV